MSVRPNLKLWVLFLSSLAMAAPLVAQQPDLSVQMSGVTMANAGSTLTYTVNVSNVGGAPATSITVTDVVPTGSVFSSVNQGSFACTTPPSGGTGTVTCTLASLAAGNSAAFDVLLTLTGPGGSTVTNTATASSSPADVNPGNNSDSRSTVIASADVGIRKLGPDFAGAGAPIAYTISMNNFGPTASVVNMHDTLPSQVTFLSIAQTSGPAYNCSTPAVGSTGTVLCSAAGGALPAGQGVSFNLVVQIAPGTPPATVITNTADVFAGSTDPNPSNDNFPWGTTVLAPGATADLAVTKTGTAFAVSGAGAGYNVTVTNNGPNAATSVTLTDVMSAEFQGETQTSGPAFSCTTPPFGGSGPVTCNIGTLAAGASASFAMAWKAGGAIGSTTTNVANVTSASPDPNPSNNTASQATTIASADLGVTKSAPATATGGANFTYTINVTNSGPTAAGPVTVSDPLPAQTTFVSLTQNSGPAFSCATPAAGANGSVDCTIASFALGAAAAFSIVVSTPLATTGPVTNTVTVSTPLGTNSDVNVTNNTASATTTLSASTAIPAMSPWALALLALGFAVTGYFALRR